MAFSYLLAEKFTCSDLLNKEEFAIDSYLIFISRTNFMLSWVEHEKTVYNLRARSDAAEFGGYSHFIWFKKGSCQFLQRIYTILVNCIKFLDNFLQFSIKYMSWVLIRSALMRSFEWVPITYVSEVFLMSMRRPTGDQEVAGSTPAEVGNILSWRLIMKYFLRSFSPFRWFKKGSCQFLAKECAQHWLTA